MIKTNGQEYLKSLLEDKVVDLNNPNCSSCNECCAITTMILPEEYENLKKFLVKDKKGREIYKNAVNRIIKHTSPDTMYLMCPFNNSKKRCDIYDKRPLICKEFHCKPELAIDYDRSKFENAKHYMIYDLFNKRKNSDA